MATRPFAYVMLVWMVSVPIAHASAGFGPAWHSSYDSALKVSKQTGKPLLLDFKASWCPPCKAMDKEVWPDPSVVRLSERFICVPIDIDLDRKTPWRYGIKSVPTVVVADPWGNTITIRVGYLPAATLAGIMGVIPSDFSELHDDYTILEKNKKDGVSLYRVGEFYRKHSIADLSNRYYKRALKSKEARSDEVLRENTLVSLGLNYLKMRKYGDARKTLQRCLKDVPNGKKRDTAMLGIVMAYLHDGRMKKAQKAFEELSAEYPGSEAVQVAHASLEEARNKTERK